MGSIFSPKELEAQLGQNLKELRLQQNLDRQTLAKQAGVSLSALKHLETGEGAAIKTFIRVIKALGRQDWLSSLTPQVTINPLTMTRAKSVRQRASKRRKKAE